MKDNDRFFTYFKPETIYSNFKCVIDNNGNVYNAIDCVSIINNLLNEKKQLQQRLNKLENNNCCNLKKH